MLRDIPTRYVLLASFLFAGTIPLMIVALLSQSAARGELLNQAQRQLESVRDLKAAELVRFFDGAVRQIEVLAAAPDTARSLAALRAVAPVVEGASAAASALRGLGAGAFEAPEAYRRVHDRVAPYLRRFATEHGFYDLFLLDAETGLTLFTVVKEPDFGVPVRGADSPLRDAFLAAVAERRSFVSDTRPYGPSANAPAQFVAAPIVVDDRVVGVLAAQIAIDAIDAIMRERSGMGRTGDTFLVGADLRLRSDTALDPVDHSVVASFAGPVAAHGVDTVAAHAALAGETGARQLRGYHGRTVLAAYAPVDFHGVRWAILAEVDADEITAKIGRALDTEISVTIALSLVLLVVLAYAVSLISSRSIGRVVAALGLLIDRVLAGRGHERLDPDDLSVDFRGVAVKTNELAAALVRQTQEKHHLEEVLQYNQRMESIGTLAGGIAHDFNNLLTYLGTYAELVAVDLPAGTRARAHIDEIVRGLDRGSALVAQIMLFSRQMKKERKPVDVALIVKEAVKLLRATLPRTITVSQSLPGEPLYVLADPTQVHQVVMNLCTNAFHAMIRTGGALEVTLARADVASDAVPGCAPGPYAALTVRDSGEGIDPAIVDRVFEPFFTTKPVGQGTGMGLAVVHGIVTAHAGHIAIDSAIDRGTTVRVLLPLHTADALAVDPSDAPPPVRGAGRILLVDDEPAICDAIGEALVSLGYAVDALTSPEAALAWVEAEPDRFDLVLTDLSMPELDGVALARRLKALRPDLPIILSTGYSERLTPEAAAELGAAALLMKPYRRHALSVALHEALASRPTSPPPDVTHS